MDSITTCLSVDTISMFLWSKVLSVSFACVHPEVNILHLSADVFILYILL